MNGGSTSNRTSPHRQLPRMILLIHDSHRSTINPQLLNNSAAASRPETRSTFYVFTKESEDVVLPLGNCKIQKIMPVLRCSANGRIDFQDVRFAQTAKLVGQFSTRRCAVIVCRLNQHRGNCCPIHRRSKPLAQF